MSWAPASPVTGGAQTSFTSPTYTLVSDVPPNAYSKQYAVTAAGGTQTGVRVHTATDPFTIMFARPQTFKAVAPVNTTTGLLRQVNRNVYQQLVRKGCLPAANQPAQVGYVRIYVDVPAGADVYDAPNVKAMCSLAIGAAWAQSSGIGDTALSGII